MPGIDIKRSLKKFLPNLIQAKADNLNEADTVMRIVKVFEDVLEYSAMTEITRESSIKDKYVDLAIKIDGTIRLLIEVKSAGTILRDRHIEQAERYAAEGNHRWVALTNGTMWNLYHLTFGEGIEYERLFSIDLSADEGLDHCCEWLGLLHRKCVKKGELDDRWARRTAMNPSSVGKSLFSEDVLGMIRRDIRKREGLALDEEDLARSIHAMMSSESREQMGPLKIHRRRKSGTPKSTTVITTSPDEPES